MKQFLFTPSCNAPWLKKPNSNAKTFESQLEGLRNQVNPHFLFNSLNTLIYLIPEDSDKAVGFVQKLSKVYRYILESRDAKIIPLAEGSGIFKSIYFSVERAIWREFAGNYQGFR